jgi:Icc-related predicted phosphoesterase
MLNGGLVVRILAVADIHFNPVILEDIKRFIESRDDIDSLLIAGDIFESFIGGDNRERQAKMYESFRDWCDHLKIQAIRYIHGNHDEVRVPEDDPYYLRHPEMIGQEKIIPFQWTVQTAMGWPREVSENKMKSLLNKLPAGKNNIILAHNPPFRCLDQIWNGARVGSPAIRKWIERVKPALWLCGHVHEGYGQSSIGRTIVLNCACQHRQSLFRGFVVEIVNGEVREVREVQ